MSLENKYFAELARRLRAAGITAGHPEKNRLTVLLNNQPVLSVSAGSDAFLLPAGSNNMEASELYHRVAQTADEVYAYPKDSRIRLTEMGADPRPLPPGSTGKLDFIDDAGQFHVEWDNGRTLALVLGKDRFSIYPPEPQTLKLYMPITADFYGRDEWGDMSECGEEWDGRTLMDHEGNILSALVKNRVPEEAERGLMHWYGEGDGVDHKVRSAVFTVEARNGRLWGVAECRVAGELTPEEFTILKEYIGGQASDGWGEGFEQRPIEVDGGELYVHLWQPDGWSIQTEQEQFAAKVAEGLPELCFSTLKTTGQLICIKRGETGYYPSEWDTGDKERNVELADELNGKLGVSPIQRQAMEVGSMAGWDVPGADPAKYQEDYPQMGGMKLG